MQTAEQNKAKLQQHDKYHHYYAYVRRSWHSNGDRKLYMRKYDKRIFAVFCV